MKIQKNKSRLPCKAPINVVLRVASPRLLRHGGKQNETTELHYYTKRISKCASPCSTCSILPGEMFNVNLACAHGRKPFNNQLLDNMFVERSCAMNTCKRYIENVPQKLKQWKNSRTTNHLYLLY